MSTTRRVFYSFNYELDAWRTSQVRNIGVVEGNKPVTDNDWEKVKQGGDEAIEEWIKTQLNNRTCTVVLVGSATADRQWIDYEIIESWNSKKGVVGIYIHGLKDKDGKTTTKGNNPFDSIKFKKDGEKLSSIVKCHTPKGKDSQEKYADIKDNLSDWVEEAIDIRNNYSQ